ncbi:MAG: hypothetical protein K9G30_04970 [Parvibaculum sp.]|nr:hypothetical protein [Parvibaculum sp.]
MQVEYTDNTFTLDAALIGNLLGIPARDVPQLMREHAITSLCEKGEGSHQGEFRLSFFFRNCRARLNITDSGRVLNRTIINFGDHPLPADLRRPGG